MIEFSIFGAGAWGTAMAVHLARCGQRVVLVPRREEQSEKMRKTRENDAYLPGIRLSESIEITSDANRALGQSRSVFFACPSMALGQLCQDLSAASALRPGASGHRFISLTKGLELDTFRAPQAVIKAAFPDNPVGVLSGPSFAREIAVGKPAALVLASEFGSAAPDIQEALSSPAMRVYLSSDVLGVELGGCLKNIYAIAAGVCVELQLGSNATAALLTRALNEMVTLAVALGADPRTLYGLSGFGDLMATCSDDQSRNRTFGRAVAKGARPETILAHQRTVVEGYRACECFYKLCREQGLVPPILNQIYAILFENKPAIQAITDLMTRSLKAETS